MKVFISVISGEVDRTSDRYIYRKWKRKDICIHIQISFYFDFLKPFSWREMFFLI